MDKNPKHSLGKGRAVGIRRDKDQKHSLERGEP